MRGNREAMARGRVVSLYALGLWDAKAGFCEGAEEGNFSLRLRLHSCLRQRGRVSWVGVYGTTEVVP